MKNNLKYKIYSNTKKAEKGITLIALVITIIVLLILAGVTIALITGENGLLTNASFASTAENTTKLGQIVAKDLNDTKYWSVNYSVAGTIGITYTNSAIKANLIEEGKPAQNGKVEYVINLNEKQATLERDGASIESGNTPTEPGTPTGGLTGVDFGTKTATTILPGDTLRIGNDAENRFMVLTNDGSTIMAMTYYNITPDTTNPEQTTTYDSTVMSTFSSSNYWNATNVNVDMTDSRNTIQQYITAYSNKLKGITNNKVTAEIGRYNGENSLSGLVGQSNSESKLLVNPGGTGDFWIGTSYTLGAGNIRFLTSTR